MSECYLFAMAGYVHTLEKPSKIKENRHSNTLKYAILYANFFESPDMKNACFEPIFAVKIQKSRRKLL